MFTNKAHIASKVKFEDSQLDDFKLENSVLKSKLQSKLDALAILNKELDKCSMERDRYKLLVEQLTNRTVSINMPTNYYKYASTNTITGGEMFAKTQDHNNMLKLEVENLRNKLEEANGDIIALRKQLHTHNTHGKSGTLNFPLNKDYEDVVQELEKMQEKHKQVLHEHQALLDEREELLCDRDYYKGKVQRLNHQISYVLSSRNKLQSDDKDVSPKPIVDIDALATENKYLQERITQLQIEKEIIKRTLTKYKGLLENRNKSSLNIKSGISGIMTQKQVREFLDLTSRTGLKKSSAAEFKSLCLGLFEALNDKSIALQHQRKTNQILANRISELEKTLDSWCYGQKYVPSFPSQLLMEEFEVDSIKSDEHKDKSYYVHNIQNQKYDSDKENKEIDNLSEKHSNCSKEKLKCELLTSTKIVLPQELEALVKEAIAEMRNV